MKTDIKIYKYLPQEASEVRHEVFITEQGFPYDYDKKDDVSTHFVMFYEEKPVAACRVFESETPGTYILGRLAVRKPFRNKGLGKQMVLRAIENTAENGGEFLLLHSQMHSRGFYEKLGFQAYGDIEDDAGAPHIWMKIKLERIEQ